MRAGTPKEARAQAKQVQKVVLGMRELEQRPVWRAIAGQEAEGRHGPPHKSAVLKNLDFFLWVEWRATKRF